VDLQNGNGRGLIPKIVTLAVDEKPGVQAIANPAPDLPPVPGKYATVARDHEYKRLGTCSILAALDLHTGHVIGHVERRHRSPEFIALLKDLGRYYPAECTIRLVLDHHSAHISKETRAFLASKPNRFLLAQHRGDPVRQDGAYVPVPRPVLCHVRVQSWEELRDGILKGIEEINTDPVVHRWKKFEALTEA